MMDKQKLRNALTGIEDDARQLRNETDDDNIHRLSRLLTDLCQLVREEIVQ
jgi:hypothetical protein